MQKINQNQSKNNQILLLERQSRKKMIETENNSQEKFNKKGIDSLLFFM